MMVVADIQRQRLLLPGRIGHECGELDALRRFCLLPVSDELGRVPAPRAHILLHHQVSSHHCIPHNTYDHNLNAKFQEIAIQFLHVQFIIFRDIMPNEELMVWYCKDFATRLGYDIDPERATYSICKYLL